ncbi:MAG: acyl-CoA thioesterase [Acetobacteraceae bacterium]|nr:acyl-CoA thioesterase [Acetobacteraceae bacterium]
MSLPPPAAARPPVPCRAAFRWFHTIGTRWMDNDVYGHVNNVVYYSWIDTAVNRFLIDHGALVIGSSAVVGIVAETGCRFIAQMAYPDDATVGLAVVHLGRSSVRYEVGVFRNAEDSAAAVGHFVHVYVDRATMRPVPIPGDVRAVLEQISRTGGD